MAGAPCPIEVMRQVIDRLGAKEMTIAYGQTEASPVITQTRTDDPLELRVETVGRPLPGVEVKIVDPATGATLPDNAQGELCARGHVVMLGYYNNPEATRQAIDPEGWLHTGDLAVRLPNGYYKITGRLKDMVIRGGENIYPREIEEFLFTHPAVEQVSVVGVPDPKYGEELCAWIKLKAGHQATAEEIQQFCRASLAHYKVPRYIRFVDSFPQTVTGKIQKYKIRQIMQEELGLSEQATA
jgi:fatty-acyl-CoA synthase